jgi:uncharacterized protein
MPTTLITGASSGIGDAFARQLGAQGHDLVLVARSEDALRELCNELMVRERISAHYVVLDLTEDGADERLFAETETKGIEIDWLINNAGFGSAGDFSTLPLNKELAMIDLNVRALVAITHRYLVRMRELGRGTIINVSSTASFQPIPFMATYAATKAFVTSFTEALVEENKPFGIRIMAFCPGSTKTNFFNASGIERPITVKGQHTAEDAVEMFLKSIGAGRARFVPGFVNKVGAALGAHLPTSLSRKFMASALRSRYQQEK